MSKSILIVFYDINGELCKTTCNIPQNKLYISFFIEHFKNKILHNQKFTIIHNTMCCPITHGSVFQIPPNDHYLKIFVE